MVARSTRDDLEQLHRNVSFFLILSHEKLSMSRIWRLNPKGVPNSLDISPSWTHYLLLEFLKPLWFCLSHLEIKGNIIRILQDDLTKLSIWKEGEYLWFFLETIVTQSFDLKVLDSHFSYITPKIRNNNNWKLIIIIII